MKHGSVILGLAFWLMMTGHLLGQCGCMDGACGSNCDCGCNSSEAVEPAEKTDDSYESENVQLMARVPLASMGVTQSNVLGNDCWGWRHEPSGREFAIFGLTNGTAFVEITNPSSPRYLGTLPGAGGNEAWRDMKVYKGRCYIVADGSTNASHGVQVFDLHRLLPSRGMPVRPQIFKADARLTSIGRAHNIAINEETGFAYVIGSPSLSSAGGPIILDLKNGTVPTVAGVFSADGYTHDCQTVVYRGPHAAMYDKEIAFCSNEDTLTILDVSNKSSITMLSRTGYPSSSYSHQGWLSPNQDFFFMNDELDEQNIATTKTRTHIWSVASLTAPTYLGFVEGTNRTIDHNLYVKGNFIYEANYTSGLRILNRTKASTLVFEEVGFFDTYPANNNVTYNGAWSAYPFFPSGNILVSDRQNGLFILKFSLP
jgi:choice-of-anchor B domain-containing protein